MFGHRSWVIVLRVTTIRRIQFEHEVCSSGVKAVCEREMWKRYGVVVIFGSEQLTSGEVRGSNKTAGGTTNVVGEFDLGGTHNQHPAKPSVTVLFGRYTEVKV